MPELTVYTTRSGVNGQFSDDALDGVKATIPFPCGHDSSLMPIERLLLL